MKMNNQRLYLKVPEFEELWYRKKLLSDPKTMEFNKGYDNEEEYYNYDNGTIDFDERQWDDFYKKWIVNNKKNFYAYIVRKYDKKFIGEIKFTQEERKGLDVNIILEDAARGFHYSYDALNLLSKEAFEKRKINKLSKVVAEKVYDSVAAFSEAGYTIEEDATPIIKFGQEEKAVVVSYSKDQYLEQSGDIFKKFISFFVKE